ncbi:MAG: DUF349 domain-containing protein [Cyclobacteriaceae bacterium]|nr:DUF349 domain-containing protein [Cyclobacteriaceae bacterium]
MKEEVNGTEQSSSVEIDAKKQESSNNMVEEGKEVEGDEISNITDSKKSVDADDSIAAPVLTEEAIANKKEEDVQEPAPDSSTDSKTSEKLPVSEKNIEVKSEVISKEKKEEPDDKALVSRAKPQSLKDELAEKDFGTYTKEQFVDLIKILAKHDSPLYAERYLKKIEPFFNEIKKIELAEATKVYIKENGNEEGFSFKVDELTNRFDANQRLIQDRKHAFSKDREAQRQSNLKKAEEALEKLRVFVDSEESSASFNKFKEIQNEWKSIGDVPGNQSKTLWANYNALINRFYDQRSIYFELKELDRKKNYQAKEKICDRAEALEDFKNLKEAISTLNDLHSEYKHLGPVPQELQEDLWQRFKAASDKVYEKRKEFVSDLKVTLLENLVKKEEIVASIKLFVEFDSDRIKEWNSKTKELMTLQKDWEAIGGLPREKSKEINKEFWSSFKTFFHNKGNFFKKLDADRKVNYDAKLVLVEKAETLKENTDWLKTANTFKTLQQDWKAIGPVPEKFRNQLYEKFKAACDFFFDNKRSQSKNDEKSYKENLNVKRDIITQILEWSAQANDHIEDLKQKSKDFNAVGYVPRKDIGSIKDKFSEAVETFINALSGDEALKNSLRMNIELGSIMGSKNSENVIYGKEQNIRRQVQQLENDVSLWKNNLEFFANSKNADDLRKDVNLKIEKAETKVISLKEQLKVLRSM